MSGLVKSLFRFRTFDSMRKTAAAGRTSAATARPLPTVFRDSDTSLDKLRPLKTGSLYDVPWAPGITDKKAGDMLKFFRAMDVTTPSAAAVAADLPFAAVDAAEIRSHTSGPLQATWIGHATILVQMSGATFITDPVFAQRCSAVQWAGPKRYTQPALSIADLPSLDFVLLSHNHYDHLCANSVKAIGNGPLWIVPEGLKAVLSGFGITHCVEMSWWDSCQPLPSNDIKVSVCLITLSAQRCHDEGPKPRRQQCD